MLHFFGSIVVGKLHWDQEEEQQQQEARGGWEREKTPHLTNTKEIWLHLFLKLLFKAQNKFKKTRAGSMRRGRKISELQRENVT